LLAAHRDPERYSAGSSPSYLDGVYSPPLAAEEGPGLALGFIPFIYTVRRFSP